MVPLKVASKVLNLLPLPFIYLRGFWGGGEGAVVVSVGLSVPTVPPEVYMYFLKCFLLLLPGDCGTGKAGKKKACKNW